jgi:serine/threonine protein kinase/class 3 adenylate cyclase
LREIGSRQKERRLQVVINRIPYDTPTGTVTFLFTDIEGSTVLWENYPIQMQEALARHDEILRAAVEASGGYVFKTVGDACCAAFATAKQALQATLAAQRALFAEKWPENAIVRVRMALHTGVAEEREGDYFGPPVNRVARLLSTGHGGQVLLSGATYNLVRDVLVHMESRAELRDLGEHRLKDLRYTERIFQLVVPDLPADFPPLRTAGLVTPTEGLATPTPPAARTTPAPKKAEAPREAVSREDRYTRKRMMGSGGMAEVYLAHDEVLDRDVALKVLRKQYVDDEQFVELFKREAKNAASLSHPNIVAVHDRGETEDGAYFIVMECVPKGTLKELIQQEGALPASTAIELTLEIAKALEAAHRRGMIHRDIKPQNVLLTESGEAKVADFGIARAASSTTITKTGGMLGTPHYVSPEVAQGQPASPVSDLYSLGVVLYEMLTGKLPYEAETPVGVVMKHVSEQLRAPREVKADVPEGINDVCVRLLAKEPEKRYRSAAELIEDLGRVKQGALPGFMATGTVIDDVAGTIRGEPEGRDGTVVDEEDAAAAGPRSGASETGGQPRLQEDRGSPASREPVPPTTSRERTKPSYTPPPAASAPSGSKNRACILVAVIGVLLLLVGGAAFAVIGLAYWGSRSNSEQSNPSPPSSPSPSPPPSSPPAASEKNDSSEAELRVAVDDYYKAVDRQDWNYAYDNLDSQTRQKYARDEYVQKNQYLANVDPVARSSPEIASKVSTSSPVEVKLTQTFRSGSTKSRTTYFVWEDDAWKHRFSQQDDDIFLPNASYDEFVRAKQSGA